MHTVQFKNQTIIPSKIVCVGRNYVKHINELGNAMPTEPVIFIKPNSAISDELTAGQGEAHHYEGELCFLVQDQQLVAVGFGIDLTKRETQARLKEARLPWERAKAFSGSAVFSEFVPLQGLDIDQLRITLAINEQLIQQGCVQEMLYKPLQLLEEIQSFLDLEDGDIVMTGTPEGVGAISSGEIFTGSVFIGDKLLVKRTWRVK